MTWNDTDRTELDKYVDEIEQNAYDLGVTVGKGLERQRIIDMLLDGWEREDSPMILAIRGKGQ
jgi:hypothetical protein